MLPAKLYHPYVFYGIVLSISFALCPILAYLSADEVNRQGTTQILLLANLCVPFLVAITMILASQNKMLISDFLQRLILFKIDLSDLAIVLFMMPAAILLATSISLLFGYSADQFELADQFTAIQSWGFLGLLIPFLLAPLVEELGWRGYGVDSLRGHYNLFFTSLIFGLLWSLWHLPAFFIKGYYHQQLLELGFIYVLNFFVSIMVIAILMNWVYYRTRRSIPALVLFHMVLNLSSMLLKTDPFTKCISTVLLAVFALIVILYDKENFFKTM